MTNLSTLKKEAREEFKEFLNDKYVNTTTIGEHRYAESSFNEYVDTLLDKVVEACEESVNDTINTVDNRDLANAISQTLTNFKK